MVDIVFASDCVVCIRCYGPRIPTGQGLVVAEEDDLAPGLRRGVLHRPQQLSHEGVEGPAARIGAKRDDGGKGTRTAGEE